MTELQESGLLFRFDEDWQVKKYDATPYYLVMSGLGMSAVDFVAFWKEEVVLIEVKNYQNRPENQLAPNRAKLEGVSPPLVAIFEEKVRETLQGISIIHRALARRWWYPILRKLLAYPRLHPFLLRSERLFWLYMDVYILANPDKVRLVLWLELAEVLEDLRPTFTAKLSTSLKANHPKVEIWNTANSKPYGVACDWATAEK